MKNVPTIDEFWASFTKSQEEAAKRREEAEKEAAKRQEEAEKEAAKRQEEWERRMAKAEEEAAKRREKWERDIAKLEALHEKTERTVNRVGKQMGELHNRFGELAEHLVAPGIIKRFNELGYHFDDTIAERVRILDRTGQKILTEIDLLLENGEYSIAVEVKTRPAEKDVAHQERRLEILREHKNRRNDGRKIRGAIAGAVFPQEVKDAVLAAGLYVIEQSGDTMMINVPDDFSPREW
jgi:hypothetical protein